METDRTGHATSSAAGQTAAASSSGSGGGEWDAMAAMASPGIGGWGHDDGDDEDDYCDDDRGFGAIGWGFGVPAAEEEQDDDGEAPRNDSPMRQPRLVGTAEVADFSCGGGSGNDEVGGGLSSPLAHRNPNTLLSSGSS